MLGYFKMNRNAWLLVILITAISCAQMNTIQVKSPNGKNVFTLLTEHGIGYTISYNGQEVILPSLIELNSSSVNFKGKLSILKVEKNIVDNEWNSNFSELSKITDHYNQLKVYLKIDDTQVNIICRAYNEGVAFAYEIPKQNNISEIGLN